MKNSMILQLFIAGAISMGYFFWFAGNIWAHCDTTGGPVIAEAKVAFETGDITPVLKWVKKEYESEIKTAFSKTILVRTKGPEAKELAEWYFFETLVRLHRAGEGEPFTGIKDEPVDPVVAMADKALSDGSADDIIRKISNHLAQVITEKLKKVLDAGKNKDKSVATGREFVEAYVTYTHFIEEIHSSIMSEGSHQQKDMAPATVKQKEHK